MDCNSKEATIIGTALCPTSTPGGIPFISATGQDTTAQPQMNSPLHKTVYLTPAEEEFILRMSSPSTSAFVGKKRRPTADSMEKQRSKFQRKDADGSLNFQTQLTYQNTNLEITISELQKENQSLRMKLTEQSKTEEESVQALEQRAEEAEKGAAKAKKKAAKLKSKLKTKTGIGMVDSLFCKISKLDATILELEKKNDVLQLKLTEQSKTEEKSVKQFQLRAEQAEEGAAKAKEEATNLQNQLTNTENRLAKSEAELATAKNEAVQKNETYKRDLEAARQAQENSSNELITVQKNLSKEQTKCQNLTKECGKLKATLKSTEQRERLLKKQLQSLETQVSELKDQLREKLDVERELVQLKCDNSNLRHIIENNDQKLKNLELEVFKSKDCAEALVSENEKMNLELKQVTWRLRRAIFQDRDSLQRLLEWYENDFEESCPSETNPLKTGLSQLETLVSHCEGALAADPALRKSCKNCEQHCAVIEALETELEKSISESTMLRILAEHADPNAYFSTSRKNLRLLKSKLKDFIVHVCSMVEIVAPRLDVHSSSTLSVMARDYDRCPSASTLIRHISKLEDEQLELRRRYSSQPYLQCKVTKDKEFQKICTELLGYYIKFSKSWKFDQHRRLLTHGSVFTVHHINSNGPDETFTFEDKYDNEIWVDTPFVEQFQKDIDEFLRREPLSAQALAAKVFVDKAYDTDESDDETDILIPEILAEDTVSAKVFVDKAYDTDESDDETDEWIPEILAEDTVYDEDTESFGWFSRW